MQSKLHVFVSSWLLYREPHSPLDSKTFQWYMSECFTAGPKHCALSHESDQSSNDIEKRIDTYIDTLRERPRPVMNGMRKALLTSGAVRSESQTSYDNHTPK